MKVNEKGDNLMDTAIENAEKNKVIKKVKYNSIDLFKFIMAVFVIAIHTNPLVNCTNITVLKIYDIIIPSAVPFFFLASGFLIATKFSKPYNSVDNISIIKKTLIKMIKLYCLWMLAYLPLTIYGYIKDGHSIYKMIFLYIRGFFLIGEHYNSWILWYLLSTIYSLIFILILSKLRLNLKAITIFGFFIILFGFVINDFVNYSGELPSFLNKIKLLFDYTIVNGRIFQGMFYIPMGMIIADKKKDLRLAIPLMLVGFIGNYFYDGIIGNVFLLICSIGIILVILNIKLKDHKIYPVLRKSSTILYFTHCYVWTIYYTIVYKTLTRGWDSFIVTTFVCIAISLLYQLKMILPIKKNIN